MTREEALDFLRRHQPLPSDEFLSRDVIDAYDEVRKYFLANPDVEALPLLLNSFGEGSGFGVYQLVEDVIARLPKDEVTPHLAKALESRHRSVRYWNAQIAARCPDAQLVQPLSALLREPDFDLRYASITALEQIGNEAARKVMRIAVESESDSQLHSLLLEALGQG